MKSFRNAATARIVVLVICSLLVVAIPFLYRLYDLTAQNAARELRLVGEQAITRVETYLTAMRSGAVDLAASQDVARGLESSLFQPYLETVVADFIRRYPAVSWVQVYNREGTIVTADP